MGASLFTEKFYEQLTQAIREHGMIVSQSESMFYNADMISDMKKFKTKYFGSVKYYYTMVPTILRKQSVFKFARWSLQPLTQMKITNGTLGYDLGDKKYYNAGIHVGSFILPNGGKQWHT